MRTLKISSNWHTIDYPCKKTGSAEITKSKYEPGFYLMEGVGGYEFFQVLEPITITGLRINGDIVMVDDPLHWIGMKLLARACRGKTLIGGLGLGLILHHLTRNNKVSKIDVVEINEDVISLISPLLPKDGRRRIYLGDVFDYRWSCGDYDTVVLDLWIRPLGEKTSIAGADKRWNMKTAYMFFKTCNHKANIYIWGVRDPSINPAYEGVSEEYFEIIKNLLR